MTTPHYVLMTVTLPEGGGSTVKAAARALGVDTSAIDATFGVRTLDITAGKYAVMVDERAVKTAAQRKGVAGPFSNPRIEPFGPPKP